MNVSEIRNTFLRRTILLIVFIPAVLLSALINGFMEGLKTIRYCPSVFRRAWEGDSLLW
jgi:hypothetical protein